MKSVLALALLLALSLACRFTASSADTPTPVPLLSAAPSTPTAESAKFNPAKLNSSEKDITYCTMGGVPLKMDIYYPETVPAPWPLVIYVHGGSWQAGDKKEGAEFRDYFGMQKYGFLAVTVNYRLAPKYKFPAQIQDVKCAIRYFRAHAAEYNLNPDKIGVWGGSAGGHLVSLLGTADASADWDVGEYLDQSSRVQAVVDMYGPSDLTREFAGGGVQIQRDVFGATSDIDPVLAAASPVTYVTADDPPFLILQGDQDNLVPLEQSQILFDKLQAAGVPSELVVVHNAGHGFQQIGGQPIIPSRQELSEKVVAFFTKYLK